MNDIPRVPTPCGGPSLHLLRRFESGELTGDEHSLVQRHVEGCASCRDVMQDFAADRAAVRATLPFAAIDARVGRRPNLFVRGWRRLAFGAAVPALGTVAVVLWLNYASNPIVSENPQPTGITPKGEYSCGPHCDLDLYVLTPGRDVHLWTAQEPLHAGDQLRVRYTSPESHVLVVSVDSDGDVFPYLSDGEQSQQVGMSKVPVLAPVGVTLDEDPRPERVFMLSSAGPLRLDEVRAAAKDDIQRAGTIERLSELSVPNTRQKSLLLQKAQR